MQNSTCSACIPSTLPQHHVFTGFDQTHDCRYEYVLSVVRTDSTYLCAGSLIAPGLALTAAHCVSKAAGGTVNPDVILGRSSMEQIFGYERFQTQSVVGGALWHVHGFSTSSWVFDMVLLGIRVLTVTFYVMQCGRTLFCNCQQVVTTN